LKKIVVGFESTSDNESIALPTELQSRQDKKYTRNFALKQSEEIALAIFMLILLI